MNTYYHRPVLFRSTFAPVPRTVFGNDLLLAAAALDQAFAGLGEGRIPVDLLEEKEAYVLRAELPGVKRDQVTLEFEDDMLSLGVSAPAGEQTGARNRTLRLPGPVQEEHIEARLEDGLLTVRLPKRLPPAPEKRVITIN